MKAPVTTLFDNGAIAPVRDYIVKDAIQKNEDLVVQYGIDVMTIPCGEIKSRIKEKPPKVYKSKFSDQEYRLIYFEWIPDKVEL